MTPDVVIYRYLEISSQEEIEFARLVELLCADADLLRNWLVLLDIPADPIQLRKALDDLPADQFQALAPAQAWVGMSFEGTARLSLELWSSVLRTAFLAQRLAERENASSGQELLAPERFRLQVLLAISGVQLRTDPGLQRIHRYRGTAVELLVDASLESRIFAVVDAVEVGRDASVAQQLLGIPDAEYAELRRDAAQSCDAYTTALQMRSDDENDWARKIWQRQRVLEACALLLRARTREQLLTCHRTVSKSLFSSVTLLLLLDADAQKLVGSSGQISVSLGNRASQVATCFALRERARLIDDNDVAVIDREVLFAMQASEAVVLPVGRDGVLVVHVEDDHDTEELGELYAQQVTRVLTQMQNGVATTGDLEDDTNTQLALEAFVNSETQRLRELVHEANNPLSIVNNYLHILGIQLQHETEAVEKLALISAELHRAEEVFKRVRNVPQTALANTFKDQGQGDATVADNQVQQFDLNERLRQLVELHKGYAAEHGVLLGFENSFTAVEVRSDPGKVSQIITNLLRNAIEASPAAQRVVVDLAAQVIRGTDQGVTVSICDSGPGISRDVLSQLTAVKTSDKGGTHQGVGLKICFELAEDLGAAIDLKTQALVGTEFQLFLPLLGPVED